MSPAKKPSISHKSRARFFDAIAHSRRQLICDVLIPRGKHGYTFNQLSQATGLIPSTLAFHLRHMEMGGILLRSPEGAHTRLSIDISYLCQMLLSFANSTGRRAVGTCGLKHANPLTTENHNPTANPKAGLQPL